MKQKRRSYYNAKWFAFSDAIQARDNHACLKCGRTSEETILQTHHKAYKKGLEPWEYPMSDCITLCKGCHAREHNLIEPNTGWTLISIDDLGGLYGVCERKGCGAELRYAHVTYHPQWGYKSVGSSCVEHLTQEDQYISQEVLKILKRISEFIDTSNWESRVSKNSKEYISTTHAHHQIRIYGNNNYYSFQIALKIKGEKWFDFGDFIQTRNKNLDQVKEMAYIVLKGLITENESEKELLRNIYKKIR
ncbi:HNH endonuclease [Hymenobacter perfusus]|uniref:HNH endonuclease n=1 Tax=Hymenobacter perfusus TaxID=1236770 RepID=A0A428JXF7_9BACT|nr:hypothetical protein [Hymenobacter perfusus]RSK38820.1 hypothetical protein EI293_21245 [Hymenobacter perfusus]